MAASTARVQSYLEAKPSIGASVLTVRLKDLREVVLAGSNLAPLMSRQADPLIGPRRQQIAEINLFLHTFARAWGLESVEPIPGGVKVEILLLPAPEPPVLQAAVGRAVIVLKDGKALAEAWIDPLEPSLEVLMTRDHATHREPKPRPPKAARKALLKAPRVLMGGPAPAPTPAWKRKEVVGGALVLLAGALVLPTLQANAARSQRATAWRDMLATAALDDGLVPAVSASIPRFQGGLDAAVAAEAVDVLQLEAGRCYLDALSKVSDPGGLAGSWTARLTFRSGGRVMALDNPVATFDDPVLAECVEQVARDLKVPDAPAGSSLELDLVLSPS